MTYNSPIRKDTQLMLFSRKKRRGKSFIRHKRPEMHICTASPQRSNALVLYESRMCVCVCTHTLVKFITRTHMHTRLAKVRKTHYKRIQLGCWPTPPVHVFGGRFKPIKPARRPEIQAAVISRAPHSFFVCKIARLFIFFFRYKMLSLQVTENLL